MPDVYFRKVRPLMFPGCKGFCLNIELKHGELQFENLSLQTHTVKSSVAICIFVWQHLSDRQELQRSEEVESGIRFASSFGGASLVFHYGSAKLKSE